MSASWSHRTQHTACISSITQQHDVHKATAQLWYMWLVASSVMQQ